MADATTVIPAADAAATEASAGRRWAWLAVPTVALVAWGAFALGSVLNAGSASPEARSTAPATLTPATSSTPTSTPTAHASRATTTAPKATPTRTAAKATAATKQTSIKPQPAHAGKGKGKGKGKAK